MFETNNSNNSSFSASLDTTSTFDTISPQNTTSSIIYDAGTLNADTFSLIPDYEVTVASGNGNIEYGDGVYDTLDLSNISVSQVEDFGFASEEEGLVFDVGNGARAFDFITLASGRQILFEGVEKIVFEDRTYSLTFDPDDPIFEYQWNLHIMGVQTAWEFTTGTDDILLGVQDTGLGVDEDGELHFDLQADETWVLSNNINDDFFREVGSSDGEIQPTSHGTSVQGIISAETNNGEGIAGINWNSDVINIDVLDGNVNDLELTGATERMIEEASANDQKLIINMSLAGGTPDPELEALIEANQDNVLFVIASGNDGADELSNPAAFAAEYDNVMAVGASWGEINEFSRVAVDPGELASYSNYGEGISVTGPTYVPSTNATFEGELNYKSFNGTSAAAPNVAGVASLVWSANSDLSATQVKQIISETAYDLGAEGYDLFYGSGLVNADAAVRRAIAVEPETTSSNFSLSTSPIISDTASPSSRSSFLPEDNSITIFASGDRVENFEVQNNLARESSNSDLPTSLFDYEAPELQQIAKLDGELVQEDLLSSPLYQ